MPGSSQTDGLVVGLSSLPPSQSLPKIINYLLLSLAFRCLFDICSRAKYLRFGEEGSGSDTLALEAVAKGKKP